VLVRRREIGHYSYVGSPLERVARAFFTVLGLTLVCLPFIGLASSHSVHWGTVPEWIGACALVFIAGGVWKLAWNGDRVQHDGSNTRVDTDA